jgi:hypothetical protein
MYLETRKQQRESKGYFGLIVMCAILFSTTIIMVMKPQEKTYKVELTLKGWQVTVDCLKQSNAPSATTNQLIDEISKQIDPILQNEAKIQDSLNKLKAKPKQ